MCCLLGLPPAIGAVNNFIYSFVTNITCSTLFFASCKQLCVFLRKLRPRPLGPFPPFVGRGLSFLRSIVRSCSNSSSWLRRRGSLQASNSRLLKTFVLIVCAHPNPPGNGTAKKVYLFLVVWQLCSFGCSGHARPPMGFTAPKLVFLSQFSLRWHQCSGDQAVGAVVTSQSGRGDGHYGLRQLGMHLLVQKFLFMFG
jgi:hypothetical protein